MFEAIARWKRNRELDAQISYVTTHLSLAFVANDQERIERLKKVISDLRSQKEAFDS